MKKCLSLIFPVLLTMIAGLLFSSCSDSDADRKVNTFVEQLNSDSFKEQTAKTGIFTDAGGKVEGDTAVVLTFKTIPGLSFKNADAKLMELQKEGTIKEFRTSATTDKVLREGFEGMKEKNMVFKMAFQDTNGEEAAIIITPTEIID